MLFFIQKVYENLFLILAVNIEKLYLLLCITKALLVSVHLYLANYL